MHRIRFIYPFFSWWIFRSFPLFWPLWIMLLWTLVYKFLCGHTFSILLGKYLGVDWLDLTFWGLARLFSNMGVPFYILTSSVWGFQLLHSLVSTCYCLSFNLAMLVGVKWYLFMVSIFISLIPNDIEHLFMCLFAISMSF